MVKKSKKFLNLIICIILSLFIGFIATYSIFYLSVDTYEYSGSKSDKSFSEIGFVNLDLNYSDLVLKEKNGEFTLNDKKQLVTCFENAKYEELPLAKAFPLFWIVAKPQNYICNFYNDLSSISNDLLYVQGKVFTYKNTVYIFKVTGMESKDVPILTAYKVKEIDEKTAKEIGGIEKTEYKKFGTIYQDLFSDSTQNYWYFHYVAIFILISLFVFVIINIIKKIKK